MAPRRWLPWLALALLFRSGAGRSVEPTSSADDMPPTSTPPVPVGEWEAAYAASKSDPLTRWYRSSGEDRPLWESMIAAYTGTGYGIRYASVEGRGVVGFRLWPLTPEGGWVEGGTFTFTD